VIKISNLHLWKTKGKEYAKEYIECMNQVDAQDKLSPDYKRMREIQDIIGIKRC
jgi:hypothetical protein